MQNKNITIQGHLKDFLTTQLNGLTGHIHYAGYPFNLVEWGQKDIVTDNENPSWWVYEQTAYWLDGYIRCAILLEDEKALAHGKQIIYNVFSNANPDGYLGPKFLKTDTLGDGFNRWPHVVFFRACMALYEYTQENEILKKLTAHYLDSPFDYSINRNVFNVEIMAWLYEKTNNKELLELAEKSYLRYNETTLNDFCDKVALSSKKPYAHGVSYNEYSKLGAILYIYTKKEEYLRSSVAAFEKIDKYFMLVAGCPCSDEFMQSNAYFRSYETCNISDYTWALSYMFKATKDAKYCDKIERCIFNAGIGSVLENFKGLQYFSCANQVIADKYSNHNLFYKGSSWMSYRPNPGTECCPGNVNRFMPNYCLNSWYIEKNDVYAALYCAGESSFRINGKEVLIQTETQYPFKEYVRFIVKSETDFTFHIRIPSWAKNTRLMVNGTTQSIQENECFIPFAIQGNTEISVWFESEICAINKENHIHFEKGPFVYALGMTENRQIDYGDQNSTEDFPAYNIYPDQEWRYGIVSKRANYISGKVCGWSLNGNLPHLEVQAIPLKNWDFERKERVSRCVNLYEKKFKKVNGKFIFTPRLPKSPIPVEDAKAKTFRLYPYAVCKLRITFFPFIKE